MKSDPLVSIIIVNYNGRFEMEQSLPSLLSQTYDRFEIIVLDNNSSDDSIEFLKSYYPDIQVITAGRNLGFGRANNVGFGASKGDLVVFSNYDVEFDPEWMRRMVDAAQSDPRIGIVMPRIMLYGAQPPIETYLVFNYVGHVFSKSIKWDEKSARPSCDVEVATGCCFLIKKTVLEEIGGFDEYFHCFSPRFFYSSLEDNDLSWRTQLAGYRIRYEPQSVIYHKYKQKPLNPLRYYYLECGRYYTILKNYDVLTLLVLCPAFAVSEILSWGYLAIKGREYIFEKYRSLSWLFNSFRIIRRARIVAQAHRRTSDVAILAGFQAETEIRHVNWPKTVRQIIEIPMNLFFRVWKSITLRLLSLLNSRSVKKGSPCEF